MVKRNIGRSNPKSLLLGFITFPRERYIFPLYNWTQKEWTPSSNIWNFKNPSSTHEKYVHMVEEIVCTSWKMSTHLHFITIICRSYFLPSLEVNSKAIEPWQLSLRFNNLIHRFWKRRRNGEKNLGRSHQKSLHLVFITFSRERYFFLF